MIRPQSYLMGTDMHKHSDSMGISFCTRYHAMFLKL